jgi:hypothetical protein
LQAGENELFKHLDLSKSDKNANLELSLALSYNDLDDHDKRRFRALGVFATNSTFPLAALDAVWELQDAFMEAQTLVDAGLLERADERYSQHPLLRAYARALLMRENELNAVLRRHFAYYEQQHNDFNANNDEDRHPQIAADFDNLRAALAWGSEDEPARACDLVSALNYYMQLHQPHAMRRALLTQGYNAALQAAYAGGQANTLQALGDLELREAHYDTARQRYTAALALFEAIPARLGQANTLQALGDLERREAHYDTARQRYTAALALAQRIPDLTCMMNSLIGLARLETALSNQAAACEYYRQLFALTDSHPVFAGHPVTQNLRREAAAAGCGGAPEARKEAQMEQALAQLAQLYRQQGEDAVRRVLQQSGVPAEIIEQLIAQFKAQLGAPPPSEEQ